MSLRRKSAPGSLNVRDDSPAPTTQTSTPRPRSNIPSISSKKSLSSLFTLASKDSSPKYVASHVVQASIDSHRAPSIADSIDIAKRQSKQADSDDNRPSPRLVRRQSRSSSSFRKVSTGSKTFLETVASGLRAAAGLFHKSPDSSEADVENVHTPHSSRKLSPKKSVRFRSGTYSGDDARSSPIPVPTKTALNLPQLDLSNLALDAALDGIGIDPIPTGRPPDTPVLKGKEQDSYFAPMPQSQSGNDSRESIFSQKALAFRTKKSDAVTGLAQDIDAGPCSATDTNVIKGQDQRPGAHSDSGHATGPGSGSEESYKTPTASYPTSVTSFDDYDIDDIAKLPKSISSSSRIDKPLSTLREATDEDQYPITDKDVVNCYLGPCSVDVTPRKHSLRSCRWCSKRHPGGEDKCWDLHPELAPWNSKESIRDPEVVALDLESSLPTPSLPGPSSSSPRYQPPHVRRRLSGAWGLESRTKAEPDSSDSEEPSILRSTCTPPSDTRPTHEDIRRRFRTPRWKEDAPPGRLRVTNPDPEDAEDVGESSSKAASDDLVKPAPEVDDTSCTSHGMHNLSTSPTDPMKVSQSEHEVYVSHIIQSSPPTVPAPISSESPAIVPDSAVSPLNLRASVSSTSPSRTRRPFRFSNSIGKSGPPSPTGNTSFSWHTRSPVTPTGPDTNPFETGSPQNEPAEGQTPSPVSVPLPLAIAPKKFGLIPTQYVDEHGWSPFTELGFPEALLEAPTLHQLLLTEGGFATFWSDAGLPKATAPKYNTKPLSKAELRKLIADAVKLQAGPSAQKMLGPHSMDKLFSPPASSYGNRFAALAGSQRSYSGEVDTPDMSVADGCSDIGPPHSGSHCKACLTRASYESSSMHDSESDLDDSSSKENYDPSDQRTPSRLPCPIAGERTPKQDDFIKKSIPPLKIPTRTYLRESETSMTTTTSAGLSEDEKFAKGII
jgi:hypothetical protein